MNSRRVPTSSMSSWNPSSAGALSRTSHSRCWCPSVGCCRPCSHRLRVVSLTPSSAASFTAFQPLSNRAAWSGVSAPGSTGSIVRFSLRRPQGSRPVVACRSSGQTTGDDRRFRVLRSQARWFPHRRTAEPAAGAAVHRDVPGGAREWQTSRSWRPTTPSASVASLAPGGRPWPTARPTATPEGSAACSLMPLTSAATGPRTPTTGSCWAPSSSQSCSSPRRVQGEAWPMSPAGWMSRTSTTSPKRSWRSATNRPWTPGRPAPAAPITPWAASTGRLRLSWTSTATRRSPPRPRAVTSTWTSC
jgi:hypothetical protein